MLFEPRPKTPPFLNIRASCKTGCKRTVPDAFPETVQIWTHWISTSDLWCRGYHTERVHKLQPKLMTTDELKVILQCRPSRKSYYKNTLTTRWQTSSSANYSSDALQASREVGIF